MANLILSAEELDPCDHGHFLTFIVPSEHGCNLRCSFCLVAQRKEITASRLSPGDYVRFIREMNGQERVLGLSLQGYEPLLPATLPFTTAILEAAAELGVGAGLVTNGTCLADAIPALRTAPPGKIGVSLDAAAAARHDRIRGVDGAWRLAIEGIEMAFERLPHTKMAAISTYLPGKRADLDGMPQLLSSLGVREWIINPLVMMAKSPWADAAKRGRMIEDLDILTGKAAASGVEMTIDDELGVLRSFLSRDEWERAASLPIRTLPEGVILSRLAPGGQLAVGEEIGRPMPAGAPVWRPGQQRAAAFLDACRARAEPDRLPLAA